MVIISRRLRTLLFFQLLLLVLLSGNSCGKSDAQVTTLPQKTSNNIKALWIDIQIYGAVPNDGQDDTAAIQTAIDEVKLFGEGTVYLPPGTYNITTLIIDSNARIQLLGYGAVLSSDSNSTTLIINTLTPGWQNRGVSISGITFTGDGTGVALEISNTPFTYLENIKIYNCAIGVYLHNTSYWTEGTILENVHILNCNMGIRFHTDGGTKSFGQTSLKDVFINLRTDGQIGVSVSTDANCYRCSWINVVIWHAANNTIGLDCDGSLAQSNIQISNEQSSGTRGTGVRLLPNADISNTRFQATFYSMDTNWIVADKTKFLSTFAIGDTTPSVKNGRIFKTNNTTYTTITAFDDSYKGQEIKVIIGDSYTSIACAATSILCNGGVDWISQKNDYLNCINDGNNWLCDAVDVN